MAAAWRQFVQRQRYLLLLLVVTVGVLIEGIYRHYRAKAVTPVQTVKEAVKGAASFPPARLVDKSSWLYLRDYVTQLVDQTTPSLALVGESGATGVFVESDLLLTSAEAVETLQATGVTLADGTRLVGGVAGFDRDVDVALLKLLSAVPNRPLEVASPEEKLNWLVAVGLNRKGSPVVSLELLSVTDLGAEEATDTFLQSTNLQVPRGAQGAAVLDFDGRLAGYIPANTGNRILWGASLDEVLTRLKGKGRAPRPWIGIEVTEVDSAVLTHLGLSSGLLVSSVSHKGPAWISGARPGDVLLQLNGRTLRRVEEYREVLTALPVGAACELQVLREGKRLRLTAALQEQSEAQRLKAGGSWIPLWGISVKPERGVVVSGEVQVSGLRVTFLAPDGPAFAAGIRPNDLLLSVDGRAARSPARLRQRLQKSQPCLIKLLRGEKYRLVLLRKSGTHGSP
jgi:serine protease Do